ncbi:MAG: DUF924 domain-containing protein [Piscinibacter sp.]|nr:DUF924 domain-containing protein [Piscinibacter sp.]
MAAARGAPVSTPQAVLDFWFGAPGTPAHGQRRPEWFRKDPAFDAAIAARFGPLIESALAGRLDTWATDAPSTLALIVVLDQFTRNCLRDTPRAFAGDRQALELARALVGRGADRELPTVQRTFAYLPFEHAEDLAAQREAVRLFEALAAEDPAEAGSLDYAIRHRDIVARFGRFPHRNAILGRASTPEEAEFLRQPGSGF